MATPKPATKPAPRKRKTAAAKPAAATSSAQPVALPGDPVSPLFTAAIDVRWRDLDAFNHVNNSSYLTFLEESRLKWLRTVPGEWFTAHAMPVMAATQLNYRRSIAWPASLHVELHVERVGATSLTLAHRILDAARPEVLYCDGNVVLVWIDPDSGKPVALPRDLRAAIAA